MESMSTNTLKSPARRLALVAAPLAVAALALTACNPTHITTMDSPTPEGSHLATPYVEEPTHEASPEASASSDSAASTSSFFKADASTNYTVASLTVDGATVDPAAFASVSVFGDAASEAGAQLMTIGLCSGATFTVTGKDSSFASDAGTSGATDKCGTAAGVALANQVNGVLQGKITVVENGDEVTIKGGKGSLVLTAAH